MLEELLVMNTGHTPGPLVVGPRGVIGERAIYVPGEPVEVLGYAYRTDDDVALENATLWAAAPDMLAAIEYALAHLPDVPSDDDYARGTYGTYAGVAYRLRAALLTARGETS